MGGRQFHQVCRIHIHGYLGNARGSKPGPKVSPGLGTCRTDVRVKCLRDARANYALHLLRIFVPCSLQLCFSWGGSHSNCFHRLCAARSTGSNAPEALRLDIVPHLLFPDPKVWACEAGNRDVKVVVVGGGGHFEKVSVKKLIVSSLLTMMISEEKNSSALRRFHAYVWCTWLWQGVLPP